MSDFRSASDAPQPAPHPGDPGDSLRHARAKGEPRFPDGPKADPAGSHFERRIRVSSPAGAG